jgi:DNA-binding SARP family transcriptional activator
VKFRILGPLDLVNDAGPIALDAPKHKALLGVLLLHPNQAVSSERLIDELWGERPPATAGKILQTYVSQLRRIVGADTIATRRPGYLLRVEEDALDATQFRRLFADGRRIAASGDNERASVRFREALALWRGPPLADVVFESFARNEVERLEEERLSALMDLIDSELALGRHEELVHEVEALVREHPLRERLRGQLMLVLYRAGRQADALELYQEGRQLLAQELGIDPGPQLKELEAKILRQDSSLLAPPQSPAARVGVEPQATPASPSATQVVRAERKVITALFADLVDFTATAERLDPEDVQALQDPYWRHVRAEIERRGGTVEKFIGDAVVALFGAPVAHEDDPERAVRAAMAIREWAREQAATQVRVGITTGEALVRLGAQPLAGEGMASGDVVNTASRLQTAATADAILVDEATYRATRDVIDYGDAEAITAKGKERPIRVWQALQAGSPLDAGSFEHARTPLVGREREVGLLTDAIARVGAERSPQLVTLIGVPGIGKSRLVYELRQAISDDSGATVTWRQGRSLPYGDGVSFWALAEIVKAQAGILETDGRDQAQVKLARAVQTLIDDAAEAKWVERHLRPLAGLGGDGETLSNPRHNEVFAAWRRFLESLAEREPVVLVFEDLQWTDDGLLDFIDGLVEWVGDVPLLVVGTARPELLDRRPNWGGGKANAITLSLAPLSDEETTKLIRELVDQQTLTHEGEQALVAHAAGNALYAEEYARMWQERGRAKQLPLPETVQGIIAARLDGLSPTEKGLLQNAAVLGTVFWEGAVHAVNGLEQHDLRECLRALQRKEFLQRVPRSSVAGDSEYAFRHVLLRDVAYNQIPRAARADKHGRAAAWIESLGRVDDQAEMLAHHRVSAFEFARAARRSSDELRSQAVVSLIRAGARASAINAFVAAAAYYERALELMPQDDSGRAQALFERARALFATADAEREAALDEARVALSEAGEVETEAEAEMLLAEVAWIEGRRDAVDRRMERPVAIVDAIEPSSAKARILAAVARFRMLAGDYDAAVHIGRDALKLAATLGLDEVRAQTLITIGAARYYSGDDAGRSDMEQGVDLALASNALGAAARGYLNLVGTADRYARALEFVAAAEQLSLRLGDLEEVRWAQAMRAALTFSLGRWDEALPRINAFIGDCDAGKPHYLEAALRLVRASIRVARDDPDGAIGDIKRALELARLAKDPQVLFSALGDATYLYAKLDRLDEASRLGRELVDADPRAPRRSIDFVLVAERLGLGEEMREAFADGSGARQRPRDALLLASAEGRFAEAAEIAVTIGAANLTAQLRVAAAEAALERGRSEEAGRQIHEALEFFRSVGATRFVHEIEDQLSTIRSGTVTKVAR